MNGAGANAEAGNGISTGRKYKENKVKNPWEIRPMTAKIPSNEDYKIRYSCRLDIAQRGKMELTATVNVLNNDLLGLSSNLKINIVVLNWVPFFSYGFLSNYFSNCILSALTRGCSLYFNISILSDIILLLSGFFKLYIS